MSLGGFLASSNVCASNDTKNMVQVFYSRLGLLMYEQFQK